jgi:tetratricopeptide (TPR) repeat protein
LASRTKQLDYAEKLYRSCLDKIAGSREMEADVYVGLIRVLKLRYKHQAILEVCKTGLKKAQLTNRLLFHTEMGRAYQHLEKHDEAIRAYEQAVQDAGKPQMLQCKRLLIDALSAAGKNDKALAECQELLKEYNQGGELREVRATLSMIYQAMGKHKLADKQLLLILESDPNDATANNDLGYVWADRNKNLDQAEKMIRKAIELDKNQRASGLAVSADADEDNAAYVDSLGWLLFRQGKLEEARAELEKAAKMPGGDDDPTVWDHLGDVQHRLKQADRAVASWKKAVSLYDQRTRRMQPERYKEIQEKIKAAK